MYIDYWLVVRATAKSKVDHEGVTFFGTHLHTHSNGRKLWVDHERDGKVLGKLQGKRLPPKKAAIKKSERR